MFGRGKRKRLAETEERINRCKLDIEKDKKAIEFLKSQKADIEDYECFGAESKKRVVALIDKDIRVVEERIECSYNELSSLGDK